PRLADRLGSDDANRLAEVDRGAAGKITPVAGAADAVAGLAGEDRADLHLLQLRRLDLLDVTLLDHLAGRNDHLVGRRIDDILGRRAPEHTLAERDDDLAGIDHRAHGDATLAAAIV